ncbi:MAG: S8 family serine peptidase [Parvularculaceae bacterium]|nr:S8 family serine peptidase [Parvularculaceae bacterium]
MLRKALLTTAATALIAATPSLAQDNAENNFVAMQGDIMAFGGDIFAFNGDISAFGGDIFAFSGDISAFGGDISAFGGDIAAFQGSFNPFHGDISPFYGDISPFWGDISAFWGDIHPFSGDIAAFGGDIAAFSGDIHPFWGDIHPFENGDPVNGGMSTYWKNIGPMWGDIYAFWGDIAAFDNPSANDLGQVQSQLLDLVAVSEEAWGELVTEKTGMSFDQFAADVMGAYGIDLDDPESLANVSGTTRSSFFMSWYDRLMALTGIDQVDHWMPLINWRPAITQDQGDGARARVGLLDAAISNTDDNVKYLRNVGGYAGNGSAHGAAVASLIAARHDGEGVMGIAPDAFVYAYNPFDATGSAGVDDIASGIEALVESRAYVINMSLGVPGSTFHQDMADVLSHRSLRRYRNKATLVVAAGNEGATQSGMIEWTRGGMDLESLLIVGSVDPTGRISSFSNRPGDACFSENGGRCTTDLMDRFIVAPGENLLVSNNEGGTMRASGTSFAAPLVTGAISLLHDRWPWLRKNAEVTTEIILRTARDLGEEGVDEVYGHGLLDVEASQSPIDFDKLTVWINDNGWQRQSMGNILDMAVDPGTLNLWQARGAYIVAYEKIGRTRRDFKIPLSTVLHGDRTHHGQFQRHVQRRLMNWAQSRAGANGQSKGKKNLVGNDFWNLSFTELGGSLGAGALQFQSEEHRFSFTSGWGEGVQMLSSIDSFRQVEDFNPGRGGANPLMGLAHGGSFASLAVELPRSMTFNFAVSGTPIEQLELNPLTGEVDQENVFFGGRDAIVASAELSFSPLERLTLGAALTGLSEENGVFGAQGGGALEVSENTQTRGMTMTARYALTDKIALAATSTVARADRNSDDAGLSVGTNGMTATAFQMNAEFDGLFAKAGRLTLSAMQPLHIEQGGLGFTSGQVTNRETGEIGLVTSNWNLGGGPRHLATEADYSVSLNDENLQIGVFSRFDFNDADIEGRFNALTVGGRLAVAF